MSTKHLSLFGVFFFPVSGEKPRKAHLAPAAVKRFRRGVFRCVSLFCLAGSALCPLWGLRPVGFPWLLPNLGQFRLVFVSVLNFLRGRRERFTSDSPDIDNILQNGRSFLRSLMEQSDARAPKPRME